MMADHLTSEQVELFLTAVSTTAPLEDVAKAASNLLAKPLPSEVRPMLRTIYLQATEIIELEQAA